MKEKNKKDNNKALIGTILFHLIVFITFMFFGLYTPLPLPEEEGVLVDLGYHSEGMGISQPQLAPQPESSSEPVAAEPAEEQIVTQSTEESISIPDAETPSPEEKPEPDRQHEEQVQDDSPVQDELAHEEPEPDPTPDPRAEFPGRDDRRTDDDGKGDTDQPGDLGRPDGAEEGDGIDGGGDNGGVEFSLSGRRATHLPMPDYTTSETGRVVVSVRVNRQGEIVRADAGARGTTTSNQVLWRLAEEAARKANFDIKRDAPEEQTGTITYNFIRLN